MLSCLKAQTRQFVRQLQKRGPAMSNPSIFNDVIGPVMRGPSSSHSAAAVRIGLVVRALMAEKLSEVTFTFDKAGSLPTTYLSQGSAMGLSGGLLGFSADDDRLPQYEHELEKAGLEIHYEIENLRDQHPNTYNIVAKNNIETREIIALSTGGGMIDITSVDGLEMTFTGDQWGLFLWQTDPSPTITSILLEENYSVTSQSSDNTLLFATGSQPLSTKTKVILNNSKEVTSYKAIPPMLPTRSGPGSQVLFTNATEMESFAQQEGLDNLSDLALRYEAALGNSTEEEVLSRMIGLVELLEKSIQSGLKGTSYHDRILGFQSGKYLDHTQKPEHINLGVLDRVIPYVTALMEVKSAMGVIVAAPTAGSCGGLPGTVLAVADVLGKDAEAKARGLLAGGIIGVLIATASTFSAEVCGCQAECGVSSGMIAAANVTMAGGDINTALSASSMALQNCFGMVCDPVANRVEVPCLGKNLLAASNGVTCANIALVGFNHIIPFDEVVEAMDSVGRSIPHELRCTALGGLSVTPTSKKIGEQLQSSCYRNKQG